MDYMKVFFFFLKLNIFFSLASFVIQFFSPLAKVKDEQHNGMTELRDVPERLKYALSLSLSLSLSLIHAQRHISSVHIIRNDSEKSSVVFPAI